MVRGSRIAAMIKKKIAMSRLDLPLAWRHIRNRWHDHQWRLRNRSLEISGTTVSRMTLICPESVLRPISPRARHGQPVGRPFLSGHRCEVHMAGEGHELCHAQP